MKCITQIISQYNTTKKDLANILNVSISVINKLETHGISKDDVYFNILKEHYPDIKPDNVKPLKHFKKKPLDISKLPENNYTYKEKPRPSQFPRIIKKHNID